MTQAETDYTLQFLQSGAERVLFSSSSFSQPPSFHPQGTLCQSYLYSLGSGSVLVCEHFPLILRCKVFSNINVWVDLKLKMELTEGRLRTSWAAGGVLEAWWLWMPRWLPFLKSLPTWNFSYDTPLLLLPHYYYSLKLVL